MVPNGMAIFVPPVAVLLGQWKLRQYFRPEGPGMLRAMREPGFYKLTRNGQVLVYCVLLGPQK